MSEPPPLAEAVTVWVREMTRAFQLRFELDVRVRRSAEVIAAVQGVREQVPDLSDASDTLLGATPEASAASAQGAGARLWQRRGRRRAKSPLHS